ncbi:MAG: carboxypeptidase regulatory-like domain-containing protein [Fibrobacterota bacterium]|nr:MAG: carboxypeptidase regulatory-like domain-containing protein [Fibrobacterota bacterium]
MAIDAKGRPLAGARIALVSVGDSTGKLAALSSTGSNGQYPSFNVPDGPYSATVRDAQDSLGKFLDTLQITGGKAKVGRDTLLALGKIRGVVRLVGGETPATVIMSLYGTDIAANVRKDGTFEIDLVPGGLFTLMGSTSLDGYGTLLRRLQLRDGQDLVIPDTLSLPVTGLLAPANLWVESDTGTGDVRVRWNQVDHPNRMGYVLEKVENGAVTMSQFLTDTVWKDSLKDHWEGLPLLGPWPSREAVYRVRTRALNGAGDTRSVAQSFVAKAPEWTHRVDSVGMVMTTDTTAEISRFRWKPFLHPSVKGWRMVRLADGVEDCSGIPVGGAWSDSGCKSATVVVIDSTVPGSPGKSRIFEQRQPLLTYKLLVQNRNGQEDALFSAGKQTKVIPWVEWERAEEPYVGGWKTGWDPNANRFRVQKVGGDWEFPPLEVDCFFGWGDSAWVLRQLDSTRVRLYSRVSAGKWVESDFVSKERILRYFVLSVRDGVPVAGAQRNNGTTMYGVFRNGQFDYSEEVALPYDQKDRISMDILNWSPISDSLLFVGTDPTSGHIWQALDVTRYLKGQPAEQKVWEFQQPEWTAEFTQGVDYNVFIWHLSKDGGYFPRFVYQNWNGDGYVLPKSQYTKSGRYNRILVKDGVIYGEFCSDQVCDGFWKAKLNFPSSR